MFERAGHETLFNLFIFKPAQPNGAQRVGVRLQVCPHLALLLRGHCVHVRNAMLRGLLVGASGAPLSSYGLPWWKLQVGGGDVALERMQTASRTFIFGYSMLCLGSLASGVNVGVGAGQCLPHPARERGGVHGRHGFSGPGTAPRRRRRVDELFVREHGGTSSGAELFTESKEAFQVRLRHALQNLLVRTLDSGQMRGFRALVGAFLPPPAALSSLGPWLLLLRDFAAKPTLFALRA
mmetsp:Transcript_39975/g.74985  ORF Transcript_39975/g.74985 Transcript_39975/m.74985 type:complete len:237 (+) Transcript_39975:119-829(+)